MNHDPYGFLETTLSLFGQLLQRNGMTVATFQMDLWGIIADKRAAVLQQIFSNGTEELRRAVLSHAANLPTMPGKKSPKEDRLAYHESVINCLYAKIDSMRKSRS